MQKNSRYNLREANIYEFGTNKKNLKEYPDKERELWRTFDSTPYELRVAMGNLDEDEMVSLLDYSRYYDKLEMPFREIGIKY